MDMNSDMSSNSTMTMMMKPYLHFTPGDFLFFSTVQPRSIGEMVGACLVLFSLAFLERLLAAYSRISEKRLNEEYDNLFCLSFLPKKKLIETASDLQTFPMRVNVPPFPNPLHPGLVFIPTKKKVTRRVFSVSRSGSAATTPVF